jgi:hypothetical protein
MFVSSRIALLAITALATSAWISPAEAQTTHQSTATVSIKKPLILTRIADMSFGSILFTGSGTFSSSVSISQNGSLSCPATYFSCSGSTSPAIYNASGNKQSIVQISAPSTLTLTNGDNAQIVMTLNAPTQLTLTNSGFPGTDFGIGGTLPLTNLTTDGTYIGTFNVTVQYQ